MKLSNLPGVNMLSSFLQPEKAYKKAGQTMQNFYNQGQNYLSPYQRQGQEAYQPLFGAMQNLLNPAQLHQDWMQSYEESPVSQYARQEAMQHGLNSASAQGLLGSSSALKAIQEGTNRISAQDRERYMDSLFRKYLAGSEVAKSLYGTGAGVASNMGQNALNFGQSMGANTYNQNSAPGRMFGDLLGLAGNMYMMNKLAPAGGNWSTTGGQ